MAPRRSGRALTIAETVGRIVGVLDATQTPYMLVGSVAASFHGMVRSTQDIDLVIEVAGKDLPALVEALQAADFYVAEAAAESAVRAGGMFNAVDNRTMWKVDLIVRQRRPFSREEFERRVRGSAMGVDAWIASAEDTILAKLEWAMKGQSDRQVNDAAGIVAIQGPSLDLAYLDRWSAQLGVEESWKRIRP